METQLFSGNIYKARHHSGKESEQDVDKNDWIIRVFLFVLALLVAMWLWSMQKKKKSERERESKYLIKERKKLFFNKKETLVHLLIYCDVKHNILQLKGVNNIFPPNNITYFQTKTEKTQKHTLTPNEECFSFQKEFESLVHFFSFSDFSILFKQWTHLKRTALWKLNIPFLKRAEYPQREEIFIGESNAVV